MIEESLSERATTVLERGSSVVENLSISIHTRRLFRRPSRLASAAFVDVKPRGGLEVVVSEFSCKAQRRR